MKRFIVYLTPSEGSVLHTSLRIYRNNISHIPDNAAMMYPPHISLTGFFGEESLESVIQTVEQDSVILGISLFNGIISDGNSITIQYIEPLYLTFFLEKLDKIPGVRRKHGLHLSLAYGKIAPDDMIQAHMLLPLLYYDPDDPWDLVIYETDRDFSYWKKIMSYTYINGMRC